MTRSRPAAGGGRQLGVSPERLGRWLHGVATRHGSFSELVPDEEGLRLVCADTTTVLLRAPFGWAPEPPLIASFTAAAARPRQAAVLLVRRGRWAVGVFDGERLVVSKVDARQVQGRTAAGGWSQQRFARRRANQTDAVVGRAVETSVRILLPHAGELAGLFTGGDRTLVDEVLSDRRLVGLAALRHGPPLDVGDPTKATLLETPKQFRAVRVTIREPSTA